MKKIYIIIFLIILLFSLIIFIRTKIAIPLKGLVIKELNKVITTKADIGFLSVDLLRGIASFSELNVKNPPGFSDENFLEIKNGYVDISLFSLLFKRVEIQKIFLDRPNVIVEIDKNSVSNRSLIFKKSSGEKEVTDAGPNTVKNNKSSFRINEFIIKDGVFKLTNYKVNPEGATALFDKIDISIKDLAISEGPEDLPTSIRCLARLPARDFAGHIELTAKGNFLTDLIDFNLDLTANNISLPYFMPFYINKAAIFAKRGHFDLHSTATCRKNKLYALQKVNIRELNLVTNPANVGANLVFGLPVMTVVEFFINNQGNLDFDFEITGTISDPKFHLTEALKKVLAKSIGNAILNNLSKLPDKILEKVKETGDIKDAGKEALKDVLKQILRPKEDEGQE